MVYKTLERLSSNFSSRTRTVLDKQDFMRLHFIYFLWDYIYELLDFPYT